MEPQAEALDRQPFQTSAQFRYVDFSAQFIDDVTLPGTLHLAFARSPWAHARIQRIDLTAARAVPGVVATVTGRDLAAEGMAWMPTLVGDRQPVLALDEVPFQGQEVVAVFATDRYAAADGAAAVQVEYEPLPAMTDPVVAWRGGEPPVDAEDGDGTNRVWHWEAGDWEATEQAFGAAATRLVEELRIPRVSGAHLETCGCVASWDATEGALTMWATTHSPEAIRTVLGLVAAHRGLTHDRITVHAPDIGGHAASKVLVYPGYVVALAGTLLTGKPVKWISERTEALLEESFAGDYRIRAEAAADASGRLTALHIQTIADRGYADAGATPTELPDDFFYVSPGPYTIGAALVEVDGVRTHKPPSGVAFRRSFRVTDTVLPTERLVDILAHERGIDPAELRLWNFAVPAAPGGSIGWGQGPAYHAATLRRAMEVIGYAELRKEQAEKRASGDLMGIGVASFAEVLGGGPARVFDILGARLTNGVEITVRPSGVSVHLGLLYGAAAHRDRCMQIVAEELGVDPTSVSLDVADGLGWTAEAGDVDQLDRATRLACRRVRDMALGIAGRLLSAAENELVWEAGRFVNKGPPEGSATLHEIAAAASADPLPGFGPTLVGTSFYRHPAINFPYGSHICVVDVDRGTGAVSIRRFVGVHGFAENTSPQPPWEEVYLPINKGLGPALYEAVVYDESGANLTSTYGDYLLTTAMDFPTWRPADPAEPRPYDNSQETNAAGEYPTVGAHAAIANAVADALWHLGVRHVDIPVTSARVWKLLRDHGVDG